MSELLKPCPFCGSDAMFRHIFENPDKCMVGCRGCDVVIDGVFPNELEAAKKWNDQVLTDEIAALRAENEELKAENERMWYELYDRDRIAEEEFYNNMET